MKEKRFLLFPNHLRSSYPILKSFALPLAFHVVRHTFACTISLGEGIPKEVLQVMMGHSSIRTTELYAKLHMEFVTRNLDKKLFHVWG